MMQARYYQAHAVEAVLNRFDAGDVATLLEMATGTGKTITFGYIAGFFPGRTLIVAHRDELIQQAYHKVRAMLPNARIEIEQGPARATLGHDGARVVIASKDTLCKPSRLGRFPPDAFDLVVVDEGHHAVKKNATYWRILKRFVAAPVGLGTAKLLFVTATVKRADNEALGGIVQSVAFRYPIWQAINDGYNVPIESYAVHVKDFDMHLPTKRNADGEMDIDPGELERICEQERYIHTVVGPAVALANENGRRRNTCVFMPNVPSAKKARDIINLRYQGDDRAICITGEMDREERRRLLDGYQRGRYQHVVTCDVLIEGWDSPRCEIIVPKPTQAWSRLVQMVGRGTRPWEGCVDLWRSASERRWAIACSPKPKLVVLDPCGVTHQHKLMNVANIFEGMYSPEVLDVARQIMRRDLSQMDVQAAVRAAQEERRLQEEQRRAALLARCEFGLEAVDLFAYFGFKRTWAPKKLYGKPATDGQVKYLERNGVRCAPGLKFWDAKVLIDGIAKQRAEAPATPRQQGVLFRFGLNPNVNGAEASRLIDQLAKNGWQRLEGDDE